MKKKDNQALSALIEALLKTDKAVWKKVASELSRPRRKRVEVNLSKIDCYAGAETVLVPGKVLGAGAISKKATVAAFSFSEKARAAIAASGGKAMSIDALHKANPDGKGVMILK